MLLEILGHASVITTQRYGRPNAKAIRADSQPRLRRLGGSRPGTKPGTGAKSGRSSTSWKQRHRLECRFLRAVSSGGRASAF